VLISNAHFLETLPPKRSTLRPVPDGSTVRSSRPGRTDGDRLGGALWNGGVGYHPRRSEATRMTEHRTEARAHDLFSEELLSLAQAARRLPRLRNDRPVATSTVWRWATRGLRGCTPATVRVGGTTCTSAEAMRRFLVATSQLPPRASPAARGQADRDTAVEQALAAEGL
jgi:hypothetical protein